MRRRYDPIGSFKAPFLRRIDIAGDANPYGTPAFSVPASMEVESPVMFLVGENGSGKSTLLEAIAWKCGFGLKGGSRDHCRGGSGEGEDPPPLAESTTLSWLPKMSKGFFLRAESFFGFAGGLDEMGPQRHDGRKLLEQSHGESFLSLIQGRFDEGIYLMDEPEAALSPRRQLALLAIMRQMEQSGRAQLIVATHSPILLSYPGAQIFSMDGQGVEQVEYESTDHYKLTLAFLKNPGLYHRRLFAEPDEGPGDGKSFD